MGKLEGLEFLDLKLIIDYNNKIKIGVCAKPTYILYTSYNKKNINNVTHGIALCLGCIYNRDEKFTCHSTKHKNY